MPAKIIGDIKCTRCKETKHRDFFRINNRGYHQQPCLSCENKHQTEYYRSLSKEVVKKRNQKQLKKYQESPQKYLWSVANKRAKEKGQEFSITVDDIVIPTHCPVFGTLLEFGGTVGNCPNSPSLDRVDSTRGYTKDNVRVISHKANTLKGNSTVEQLEQILKYMRT